MDTASVSYQPRHASRWWLAFAAAGVTLLLVWKAGLFSSGPSLADRLHSLKGGTWQCDKVGFMLLAGKRDLVYRCQNQAAVVPQPGCYVSDSGLAVNVTTQFRRLIRLQNQTPPC